MYVQPCPSVVTKTFTQLAAKEQLVLHGYSGRSTMFDGRR